MYLLFKENNKIIRKEKIDEYLIKKPILNTLRAKYLYKADYLMQEKQKTDNLDEAKRLATTQMYVLNEKL